MRNNAASTKVWAVACCVYAHGGVIRLICVRMHAMSDIACRAYAHAGATRLSAVWMYMVADNARTLAPYEEADWNPRPCRRQRGKRG